MDLRRAADGIGSRPLARRPRAAALALFVLLAVTLATPARASSTSSAGSGRAPLACAARAPSDAGRWWRVDLPVVEPPPTAVPRSLYDYEWTFSVSAQDPRVVYVANVWFVYKSTDGGCSWEKSFSVFDGNPNAGADWTDRIVAVHAPTDAADDARAYLLLDRGGVPFLGVQSPEADDWTVTPLSHAGTGVPLSGSPRRLWVAPSDPRVLYAEVGSSYVTADRTRLYRSGDGGAGWELQHTFVPEAAELTWWASDLSCPADDGRCPLVDVRVMEVDPADPSVLWTATENGIFRSADAGSSWDNVHRLTRGTLLSVGTLDLSRRRGGQTRVAVFGFVGLAWTEDAGRTWELRDPPPGRLSSGQRSTSSTTKSAASGSTGRIVAVLDATQSYAGANVQVQRGDGWAPATPRSLGCSGEERGNCLDLVEFVARARAYYAIESDGSHLWAFRPGR